MPEMPPTYRPGGQRARVESRREYDFKRRREKPWRRWYATPTWRAIRRRQLIDEPYCRRCHARGHVVEANTVNHVEPHRGDWDKFITGPFESLCKSCHDSDVQREERAKG